MKNKQLKIKPTLSSLIAHKKPLINTFIASILGSCLYISTNTPAYAIYCSNCSTFYQQMFEYAEAVNTTLHTAEQLSTQIQQYNNMITQGLSLPNSMFISINNDMERVANIYNQAQSLGRNVESIETQFNAQYPDYEKHLNNFYQSSGTASSSTSEQFKIWASKGFDSVKTAMKSAGMNISTFADEDAHLKQLVNRSQSSAGRMQAIQAGNEIAVSNVQQLQKLRDLVATQITAQANYLALETDRQATSDAAAEQFQARPNTRGPSRGF
ncbi:P-type conjugative transfer protein TrbJ [Pseudomonas lundensis]|uniref:P-type conjugative transfer protein TrbJ n=1 Tax=Pseudomonas lundensis TaxID=86185 RepID=A0A266N9C7_9PSED|nr:P-type conjugative transfer protein TrbJ [Pseudomonas lundensis]OZY59056.1 P-type conjugative transfer protein TrbJ [Pseudomonas lundensis]